MRYSFDRLPWLPDMGHAGGCSRGEREIERKRSLGGGIPRGSRSSENRMRGRKAPTIGFHSFTFTGRVSYRN